MFCEKLKVSVTTVTTDTLKSTWFFYIQVKFDCFFSFCWLFCLKKSLIQKDKVLTAVVVMMVELSSWLPPATPVVHSSSPRASGSSSSSERSRSPTSDSVLVDGAVWADTVSLFCLSLIVLLRGWHQESNPWSTSTKVMWRSEWDLESVWMT